MNTALRQLSRATDVTGDNAHANHVGDVRFQPHHVDARSLEQGFHLFEQSLQRGRPRGKTAKATDWQTLPPDEIEAEDWFPHTGFGVGVNQ